MLMSHVVLLFVMFVSWQSSSRTWLGGQMLAPAPPGHGLTTHRTQVGPSPLAHTMYLWYHGLIMDWSKGTLVYKLDYDVPSTLGFKQSSVTSLFSHLDYSTSVRRPTTPTCLLAETNWSRTCGTADSHFLRGSKALDDTCFITNNNCFSLLSNLSINSAWSPKFPCIFCFFLLTLNLDNFYF